MMSPILQIFRQPAFGLAVLSLLCTPLRAAEAKPPKETTGPVPSFAPAGGVFSDPVLVDLKAQDPAATIRFTLNGSEPSAKAEAFSKPIRLTATTLVKARAFLEGKPAGPTASQTYTVIEKELEKFTSNLPLVILNTFG